MLKSPVCAQQGAFQYKEYKMIDLQNIQSTISAIMSSSHSGRSLYYSSEIIRRNGRFRAYEEFKQSQSFTAVNDEDVQTYCSYRILPFLLNLLLKNHVRIQFSLFSENPNEYEFQLKDGLYLNHYTENIATDRYNGINTHIQFIKINRGITGFRGAVSQMELIPQTIKQIPEFLKSQYKEFITMNVGTNSVGNCVINIYVTEHNANLINSTLYLIPYILKHAFEIPCDEELVTTITALPSKSTNEYVQTILTLFQKILITSQKEKQESAINNLTKYIIESKKSNITDTINDYKQVIHQLQESLANNYTKLYRAQCEMMGFEGKLASLPEQIQKTFEQFKDGVELKEFDNEYAKIQVRTVLTNYDSSKTDIVADARFGESSVVKAAFKKLFSDGEWCLKVQQTYKVNFRYNNCERAFRTDYLHDVLHYNDGLLPNPHIAYFNCFGQNQDIIRSALITNNITALLTSLLATTANINMCDSVVTNRFCQTLDSLIHDTEFDKVQMIYNRDTDETITLGEFKNIIIEELNNETNQTEQG